MSPEQAKGKTADRRSDIWSFGVVLYEMLTGRRLFSGETAQETLAAVLRAEPDWSALPASAPARVRLLLRRCLDKDPRRRIQAIGETRIAIEDTLGGAAEETALAVPHAAPRWQRGLPWALGGALIGAALALWAPWRPAPEPATPVRLSVELGADASLATGWGPAAILSPDGKLLAFTARKAAGQQPQLYVRRLELPAPRPRATPGPGHADGAGGLRRRGARVAGGRGASLKGALRLVGIDPPKRHDVRRALLRGAERFPAELRGELGYLADASSRLVDERAQAFYGDESGTVDASEIFGAGDGRRALRPADTCACSSRGAASQHESHLVVATTRSNRDGLATTPTLGRA